MSLVSCIMATRNRPHFLQQAVRYFQQQTFTDSELIIVDDSIDSCEHLLPHDSRIIYVRLTNCTLLGEKLNIAARISSGDIIQKLDDDDYYHPQFLETMVSVLLRQGHKDVIAAMGAFLVLIVGSPHPHLHLAGTGWFAGGTLSFFREAWEDAPFRKFAYREDAAFLHDHPELQKIHVDNPELYVLVRHGNHTWQTLPCAVNGRNHSWRAGMDVTDYFSACPCYSKRIEQLMPADDAVFYQELALPPVLV